MRLENKVAVVTGAMSGIGKKIGERFLEEGAKVIFSDINEDGSVEEYGENAKYVKCDVSSSEEVDNLVKEAVRSFGKIDIIVNNAGIGDAQGIADVTDDNWDKVIGVNLSGVMYGMRAATREMVSGGVIINMSSILGKVGFPGAISYCAAKGGVVQLTHAGAIDLAKSKIRVNAIAPGFIKTKMTEDLLEMDEFRNMIESSTPLGYLGDPLDIANAAVYLASDESKYVTGEVIYVDGGWTAR
ncbi:MAG: SDR family oxidoreductase [Candidatus Pacebacteria bacterium]|nr:SDR family oxidoreductase [Candidatus Paceibacterota bacterium]